MYVRAEKSKWSFEDVFPLIGKIIDEELCTVDLVDRNMIAKRLHVIQSNHNFTEVENMVDWFSANFTTKSEKVLPWINKYSRIKVRKKGRRYWAYKFKEPFFDSEILEEYKLTVREGNFAERLVNIYERNPRARVICIAHHGKICVCCGFNFFEVYGDIGKDFIHVHHLKLISEAKEEYELDPIRDLRPVCPNCHAMIHRKDPPFTIEEIRSMMSKNVELSASPPNACPHRIKEPS